MSPIDDELRALLTSRASDVPPAPDPLGGIETRARGLRRRRLLTSVSGAAAVVVAVAVAVPLLVSGTDKAAVNSPGDPSPTVSAVETPYRPANLLPWQRSSSLDRFGSSSNYLGRIGQLLGEQDYGKVGFVPLWDGPTEDAFEATVGQAWLGTDEAKLVTVGDGDQLGPVVDPSKPYVAFAVGKTKGTLIVVAAPDAVVEYAAEGGNGWQQISGVGQAPAGVGLVPLDAEDPNDSIRVTEADGTQVVASAPDWTPAFTGTPVNVLDTWVHRGDPQSLSDAEVVKAYDHAVSGTGGHYRSLYDGTRDGLRFTLGQAWAAGETAAHTVAYDSDGTFYLGPETPRDPWVLGAVFSTGAAKDLLVLLPRPGAGRIAYSPDATSPFNDVASGRSQQMEVGLVDRDPMAQQDRVQVHRGDDSIILTEGIAKLTCGAKECG